ncbi:hypothetical protein [Polyangium fumosum]|uniref:Protein-tyrosine-phosphatase n=1 Tax=Polyangium fumosum TaxID=889272 RepID=A0A4U1JJY6_9BACT|nr:hypothetical protein [Polyangium fumosum]TKD13056.1 hypothetical protein E8A74_00420 [Polyangium fumosum]
MTTKPHRPLCFADATGGALAALGAAVARALGHTDAVAATSGEVSPLPAEVPAVLAEIGLETPSILKLDEALVNPHAVVWLAEGAAPVADARTLACKLAPADAGELERMATARIVRDRIERMLELEQATG